jgi:hypothetical protein
MKKLAITSLITFAFSISSFAQEELFKVLISKGKNVVDNSKPVFAGSKIHKGQTITIVPGGYLGLIYKNGRSMELKTPGDYPVDNLEKNALASSGSFSKKYADLVMTEMTKTTEDLSANRKKNSGVTGSVNRGGSDKILILSPNSSDLLSNEVKVRWLKDSLGQNGYTVKLKDMYDEPLKTYETADTFVTIVIPELGLKQTKSFIFTVEAKTKAKTSQSSEGKLVKVLDGKKAEDLQKEMKNVKEEAGSESALSNIILAAFCEQHKLYLEAINYYEQAIALEPSVEEYKYAYENFLLRSGVVKDQAPKK